MTTVIRAGFGLPLHSLWSERDPMPGEVITLKRVVVLVRVGLVALTAVGSRSAGLMAQRTRPQPHPSTQDPSVLVTPATSGALGNRAVELGPVGSGRPARHPESDHPGADAGGHAVGQPF